MEIVRNRGLFGSVIVLYEVVNNGSNGTMEAAVKCFLMLLLIDLSMVTGGIVFEPGVDSMVFLEFWDAPMEFIYVFSDD